MEQKKLPDEQLSRVRPHLMVTPIKCKVDCDRDVQLEVQNLKLVP